MTPRPRRAEDGRPPSRRGAPASDARGARAPGPHAAPVARESFPRRCDRHDGELDRFHLDRLTPRWSATGVPLRRGALAVPGATTLVTATLSLDLWDPWSPPRHWVWMRYLERWDDESWAVRTARDIEARFPGGAEDDVEGHFARLRPPVTRRHL